MFTAEELEDLDIFPKKITMVGVIKFFFYFIIMVSGLIMLYCFYSGRNFTSIVSMEGMRYNTDNYFTERLFELDAKTNYDLKDKYHINLTDIDSKTFIKEYVRENLPCIIRNATFDWTASLLWLSDKYMIDRIGNYSFKVEERNSPSANFFSEGYKLYEMEYNKFIKINNDKDRFYNYFINEQDIPKAIFSDVDIFSWIFLEDLKFKSLKYSEGNNEMHNPAFSTPDESIICQVVGQLELIIVPALQRNNIYPFIRPYGPTNYSPINLFRPEYGRFPNFKKASRLYINLEQGDCLYIPSSWWYSSKTVNDQKFITLTANFKSHSRVVENIINLLENNNFQ
jgi:hypothetical protein